MTYIISINGKSTGVQYGSRSVAIEEALDVWQDVGGYIEVVTISEPKCVFMIGYPEPTHKPACPAVDGFGCHCAD